MASPRNSFGTHNCGSPFLGEFDEPIQGFLKFRCLHVISEAAEAGISPPNIDGVAMRMPQSTKSSHVPISDPSRLKRVR
jgi:hypothetical protein